MPSTMKGELKKHTHKCTLLQLPIAITSVTQVVDMPMHLDIG